MLFKPNCIANQQDEKNYSNHDSGIVARHSSGDGRDKSTNSQADPAR